ncbi:MAG: radical SAM protein, partial [Deltaproteobacteria bacterium]
MGIKIVICNVPLRSEDARTTYPPLGAMFVTQALKSGGYNPLFYDINYFRPAFSEIRDYFLRHRPDVIGISATVSTTYAYVKKLSLLIKEILPHSMIVVGGAITASSDIILKFTKVDICVTGEGEQVMAHLLDYFSKQGLVKIDEELKKVLGICFLNQTADMVFTGYEIQIPAHEIPDPDYEILKEFSELDGYIIDPKYYPQFKYDRRVNEVKRQGKKMATVVTSRGCIARCTFCHRWQKGLRILPVDRVIDHIKFLMERHDVGFISFGDEDFGASQKWVDEFVEKISTLDILYRIGAIRVDHVDLPVLKKYQESGCVAIHYGMESGSDRILSVMEKRATVQMNRDAAIKTFQAGLQTVPAAVVGMPGETYGTIEETARFLQDITEFYPYDPLISPNLLVALPGTPVYE